MEVGPYTGEIATRYCVRTLENQLAELPCLMHGKEAVVLQEGRNRNVRLMLATDGDPLTVVVKSFGKQSAWKDRRARVRGSKAQNTWRAACHLEQHGIGTPPPIGFLERWDNGRLLESYYLAEYLPDMSSFTDELGHLLCEESECDKLMGLLECVAQAVSAMHRSGFQHLDLGNQNILLKRLGSHEWGDVNFIDLNRARIHHELSPEQRARDLSRLAIPSDLLRVFRYMYFDSSTPRGFVEIEERFRRRYAFHDRSRRWRHPLREARVRRELQGRSPYPASRDVWIWDERSAQTVNAWISKDKRKLYPRGRHLRIAGATLTGLLPVWGHYKRLLCECYSQPVDMKNRVGIAIEPTPERFERQKELLRPLGNVPLLIRFHRRESMNEWNNRIVQVRELSERGHSVSLALLQDRAAVKSPDLWATFISHVVGRLGDVVEYVELGHAINRAKWGIWDYREYGGMMAATAAATEWLPDTHFCGPACIDFEYPDVVAALRQVPPALRLSALSHHLYVDRRGAPENPQGRFATLEKLALARAIARWSPTCEDRLIVSEVNWPVKGMGIYSPVGSPYVCPGPRPDDPSVSEEDYADYMLRYLLIACCSGMAERVFWWRLVARGYGLVDDSKESDWRPRPGYKAFVQFTRVLSATRFVGKTDTSDAMTHAFEFENASASPLIVAYTEKDTATWQPPFTIEKVEDREGNPLPAREGALHLTGSPVYLFGAPR